MSPRNLDGFRSDHFMSALRGQAPSEWKPGLRILLVVVTIREMSEAFLQWVREVIGLEICGVIGPKSHATSQGIYGIDRANAFLFNSTSGLNRGALAKPSMDKFLDKEFDSVITLQGSLPEETYRAAMEVVDEIAKEKPVFIVRPNGTVERYSREITSRARGPLRSVTSCASKKVALVNAGSDPNSKSCLPFNLSPLAQSLVARGHEVSVLEQANLEDVGRTLEQLKPDVIGVSATTLSYIDACSILSKARQRLDARLILGGRHATIFPFPALKYADVVVAGEGENAIIEAVESPNPPSVINGSPLADLTTLPPVPYDLFDMPFYLGARDRVPWSQFRFAPPGSKVGQLFTSRGCPWNCAFCHNSYQKLPMRFHGLDTLERELDALTGRWGCKYVCFFDDDLLADRKRFDNIASLFKNEYNGIGWSAQTRVVSIDDELAKTAREAGCLQLIFGFESGSQRILQLLKNKKQSSLADNRRALEICRRNGIKTFCSFMIGAPSETEADMRMTERFILEEDMDDATLFQVTPYPGTFLWNRYIQEAGVRLETGTDPWGRFHMGPNAYNICETMTPERLSEIFFEISDKMARRFRQVIVSPHASVHA